MNIIKEAVLFTVLLSVSVVMIGCTQNNGSACMKKCEQFNGNEYKACMKGCIGNPAKSKPLFSKKSDEEYFTDCVEQLAHIKTGIESYLAENDSLVDMDSKAEGVCNHVLPGYEIAADCKGQLEENIKQYCKEYEIQVVGDDSFSYEIIGKAKDSQNCCIVITEIGFEPQSYSTCSSECPEPLH